MCHDLLVNVRLRIVKCMHALGDIPYGYQ